MSRLGRFGARSSSANFTAEFISMFRVLSACTQSLDEIYRAIKYTFGNCVDTILFRFD